MLTVLHILGRIKFGSSCEQNFPLGVENLISCKLVTSNKVNINGMGLPFVYREFIVLFRSFCRRKFCFNRGCLVVFLAFEFFVLVMGCWPNTSPPNLGDQVICDRGFLPLAFIENLSVYLMVRVLVLWHENV